jgi:hypothetical protein
VFKRIVVTLKSLANNASVSQRFQRCVEKAKYNPRVVAELQLWAEISERLRRNSALPVVALSSRDKAAYEKALPAFQALVGSYLVFTPLTPAE